MENVWTAEVARFDRIYIKVNIKLKECAFKEMKFCFKEIRKKLR